VARNGSVTGFGAGDGANGAAPRGKILPRGRDRAGRAQPFCEQMNSA
jgi:hypothetical protein